VPDHRAETDVAVSTSVQLAEMLERLKAIDVSGQPWKTSAVVRSVCSAGVGPKSPAPGRPVVE
jgi:hypothetical protein